MSLSLTRLAVIVLAAPLALAGALSPATAQNTSYFNVELAAPASEARVIAGGVVFTCAGTTCTASRSSDRPLRVCSELRREVGSIATFSANGEALAESRLARCNG